MSKKAAEHHKQSQEHHTHAARHHGEQLSTMRADSTKKQPIMRIPPGDTRFTLDITQTKPPWLIWKSTARSSRFKMWFGGRLGWRPLSI
jgi:hypothetical protein